MAQTFNQEEILKKVLAGETLTEREELFYMIEVLGYPEDEAKRIIEIAKNTDPNKLID